MQYSCQVITIKIVMKLRLDVFVFRKFSFYILPGAWQILSPLNILRITKLNAVIHNPKWWVVLWNRPPSWIH